ncbi:adenosine deaminase [Allokutzneria sp. A3M-2-11 16]|uniref:adenosine deaminase n=1 Tax=Allokutzneria sp. A3M-2-11 16 TaxID=2962043 RepID=UPI0020B7EEB6|nr:adenosine deaminase [Allokutzneria sp. A3M-2-11 16]MCP3804464.1 adenosine deaminase [Allokutzneria sp. A3M-2-11 16]
MRDVTRLPKAHLHVHLESTIRWRTLREIGAANGVEVPAHLGDGRTVFTGFREFADANSIIRSCLLRPEDFTRIALEFCEDEAAQGTRYVEVTFTAAAHGERLGDLDMPLEAVLRGLEEGQRRHDVVCRVILDHSRRRSVDRAWNTLKLAKAHDAVIGIGMAGEEAYPLAPFAEVITAAEEAGLHPLHHAGEDCGPDSIREAIHIGRTKRLGHGVRVLDDPELVAEVRDLLMPLEVCPSSNVILGVAESLAAHPLPRLVDAGLVVTLNTDIPNMMGISLSDEYVRVRDAFGCSDSELAAFARAGVDASFAPDELKTRLHKEITQWLARP